MDSSLIVYTGLNLSTIGVSPNTDLEDALSSINTAVANNSSAPDYSGYNLYCVKQVDGLTHPTNTQNFAEGISKALCDFKTDYTTFVGTTYTTAIDTMTSAINNLQEPQYTCAIFSITHDDDINTVWNKTFDGCLGIIESINPEGADWAALGETNVNSIVNAFNIVINILAALPAQLAGLEPTIGTFDNSSNCLQGLEEMNTRDTIISLINYVCNLNTFDVNSITWGCVSPGTDLQSSFQNLINFCSDVSNLYVSTAGTGLTLTSGIDCVGKSLSIDTTWNGLYKAKVSSSDSTAGYLGTKIVSTDNSVTIDILTDPSKVDLSVTVPDNKVLAQSGGTSGYLVDKIINASGDWGLSVIVSVVDDKLLIRPSVTDAKLFVTEFASYISGDVDAKAIFCDLVASCTP